jgi:Ca2+:H+ antiporter
VPEDQLQRTMNIAPGTTLATIGLTIPAAPCIGRPTGKTIKPGQEEPETDLLLITLPVSIVNFSSERTYAIHGFVHLVLFSTSIVLIFD